MASQPIYQFYTELKGYEPKVWRRLVSIFSKYKGTDGFAKWIRGIYNVSGEDAEVSLEDFSKEMSSSFTQKDLTDFFMRTRQEN